MMQFIIPESKMHFTLTEFNALSEAKATVAASPEIGPNKLGRKETEPKTSKPQLEIFSFSYESFRDSELKHVGWKRPSNAPPVKCPKTSFWVDKSTGEIFTQKQVQERGITIGPSPSLRMILVQSLIQSCPPSKRSFVCYILNLRNTRGGLIMDLKTALDRWITIESPNMHSTDRARKRKTLETFLYDRKILANNQTFTKDLQFIAKSTKIDYVGEESSLFRAFPVIGKPGRGFPTNPVTEAERLREWDESMRAAKAKRTGAEPPVNAYTDADTDSQVNGDDGKTLQ
jgi:hypothetical protein